MPLEMNNLDSSLARLVDSVIPVVSGILWIMAIRLLNRWLPKNKNDKNNTDGDDEGYPDIH